MNNICLFRNPQFGDIRALELNGNPWFVGKDVAEALGYSNTRDAIKKHIDGEDKGVASCDTPSGTQEMTIINESGLYSLILSSKLPGAKKFKHWVTSEVLPALRKNGGYIVGQNEMTDAELLAKAVMVAQRTIESQNKQLAEQKKALDEMAPKIQYLDTILESHGTIATTQIAADYGMSANKLNKILHEAGLQHSCNGQWVLYAKYFGQGLAKSRTFHFKHKDGRDDTRMMTMWTQKGRVVIHNILSEMGIKAEMDK